MYGKREFHIDIFNPAIPDERHGTNDILVSEVLRTNELQVWFLSEHLVEMPLVQAK